LPITVQHTQESLCLAHIYAVAGIAGVNYAIKKIYDYGVDGQFSAVVRRGDRLVDSGYPLDFQAKATINWTLTDQHIVYDLEAKTYNDIVSRTPSETTLLLILLCLPKVQTDWHGTSCEETILRHCCYWHILTGEPTSNTTTKTIYIPAANLLTPTSLNNLLSLERARRLNQSL
jgi:Domain of unknown function (DUF4365)